MWPRTYTRWHCAIGSWAFEGTLSQLHSATCSVAIAQLVRRRGSVSSNDDEDETEHENDHHYQGKPSEVWTRLSELTSEKLVIGMLIIMVVVPLLRTSPNDLGPVTSLESLDHQPLYSMYFNVSLTNLLHFYKLHNYKLLYLGVKDGCLYPESILLKNCSATSTSSTCKGVEDGATYNQVIPAIHEQEDAKTNAEMKYRDSELLKVTSDSQRSEAYFSVKKETQLYHAFDLAITIIILLILSAWSFFLSWDSNKLLIQWMLGLVLPSFAEKGMMPNHISSLPEFPSSMAPSRRQSHCSTILPPIDNKLIQQELVNCFVGLTTGSPPLSSACSRQNFAGSRVTHPMVVTIAF
eukprot:Gb_02190 [translate_table: standard]